MAVLGTGATLAYFEEALPTTLNPLYADSMVDYRAQELIFDRLWYHDAITNDLESRLVERWELAEGGKAMRLTLKPNVKWHDLQPLTAKDVCFTVAAMLDPKTPSIVAQQYRSVLTGCDTDGADVAILKFTQVFHNPRERLGFAVLPASAFPSTAIAPDMAFSARPIGTGPMKGAKGTRGVTFDAFPNGQHTPQIAQLQLQEGGDPLVQVRTLINNGVQGIIAVPPPLRPDLRASDEVAMKSYDLRSWWFVAVNTAKAPLHDQRVRQGLDLLIDRNELRKFSIGWSPEQKNSPCELISGPFVQSSPYYNRTVPVNETADRAKAETLLTAAGLTQVGGRWHFAGAPVTLDVGMLASLDHEAPDLLDQVGNQLGAAGFERQVHKISADEWNRVVKTGKATEYDLVIGKWSFGLVEDVNHLFHTRAKGQGSLNIFDYSNSEVDRLLESYEKAYTDTEAQDAYHALHALLAEDLPYLFLWKLDTKSSWRTEVKGNVVAPYFYFTEFDRWNYSSTAP